MKKSILIIASILIGLILFFGALFLSEINIVKLNFVHRWVANSVADSWDEYLIKHSKRQESNS